MEPFRNLSPERVIGTLEELRLAMAQSSPAGTAFLDYLIEGPYRSGKGVWVNRRDEIVAFYADLLAASPHLQSESPYGEEYRTDGVRIRGENRIVLANFANAPAQHREVVENHRKNLADGATRPQAIFAGGPAAKIAAILASLDKEGRNPDHDSAFVLDGAEQSNESGSASYEHVNHANALNAEQDNTGLGIFFTAMKRALFGERDPAAALDVNYKKVDLWPGAIRVRDIPIYLGNEFHGRWQTVKSWLGLQNDHAKSRIASRMSTGILSFLESRLNCSFRLSNEVKRAFFIYFTPAHYRHSLKDNAELSQTVGLRPRGLCADELARFYGPGILKRIVAADLFPENACIRHGFEAICREVMERRNVRYWHRQAIRRIYLEAADGTSRAVAVVIEDLRSRESRCVPVDHLALSLGPTATYHYETPPRLADRIKDRLEIGLPVPYQTIATGLSAQVLFRITDAARREEIPFTGMKQTHFVEMGRTDTHVLMKLTCGGVIGLPVYSRSYGISALASLLRTITPEMGLQFEDVVCAWPCTRAVNASNNGQIARVADNCVVRFGEGGTGMSKMGTNAQTMLDLLGLDWPLPEQLAMPRALYSHTVLDRRRLVAMRLRQGS